MEIRIFEYCPYCHEKIWGTENNIDSGLRKHIEYCPEADRFYQDQEGDT